MAFVEVYGIPLRLGRYGPGATDQDIQKLLSAVVNLGSDAAAVIHDSMKIDFQNAVQGTGNNELFKVAAEWWDRQISKLVLCQTASTEGTPGKLGNEDAQHEVRQDLVKAESKHLGNTLNRDLVRPSIDLNFGPQAAYPRIVLHVPDSEDLKQLTDALARLVPLGLKVEQSVVRDKFALPDPAEDAELLAPPQAAPAPPPVEPDPAANRALARKFAGRLPQASGAAAGDPAGTSGFTDLDELEELGLADWQEQIAPILAPLRQTVAEADSYDELVKRLQGLLGQMDTRVLVDALAKAAGDSGGKTRG
jgi:phage gp29-like protein